MQSRQQNWGFITFVTCSDGAVVNFTAVLTGSNGDTEPRQETCYMFSTQLKRLKHAVKSTSLQLLEIQNLPGNILYFSSQHTTSLACLWLCQPHIFVSAKDQSSFVKPNPISKAHQI